MLSQMSQTKSSFHSIFQSGFLFLRFTKTIVKNQKVMERSEITLTNAPKRRMLYCSSCKLYDYQGLSVEQEGRLDLIFLQIVNLLTALQSENLDMKK